jgi:hypothetical protein
VTHRNRHWVSSTSPSSRPRWSRPRHLPRLVGRKERRRAGLAHALELALGEELRDRRAHLAVGAEDDVGEALRAPRADHRLELVELTARELPRHRQEPNGRGLGEHAELGPACDLRRILDLEAEAQVGPVDPETEHRLVVGDPLERRRELDADALPPDALHDPLHQLEDELLLGERHLDVELRQLLEPVGAQILVPEAARNLVVALEARDDEQLLRDLRRLRERVEASRLEARGHEEVARAFGGRLPEDRRLDVDEALGLHLLADDRHELAAHADVPLHVVPAQVEPAVAEAKRLVDALLVELERQRRAARDDLELLDPQLHLARRHARVHGLGRARDDLARRQQDELGADRVRGLGGRRRRLRVYDKLADAGLVPEVDEDEPAVVAPPGRPAGERHAATRIGRTGLPAAEVTPRHRRPPRREP